MALAVTLVDSVVSSDSGYTWAYGFQGSGGCFLSLTITESSYYPVFDMHGIVSIVVYVVLYGSYETEGEVQAYLTVYSRTHAPACGIFDIDSAGPGVVLSVVSRIVCSINEVVLIPGIVPREGTAEMLRRILHARDTGDLILHLYTNKHRVDTDTSLVHLHEVVSGGYSPKRLLGSSWTITVSEHGTEARAPEQVFSFDTPLVIQGYFLTDLSGEMLIWGELLDNGPIVIPPGGGEFGLVPRLSLS